MTSVVNFVIGSLEPSMSFLNTVIGLRVVFQ